MRYALSEAEWKIIPPILPTKSRGVPRVDDRRVLNGIFWVLRSGAPWRDLPDQCGPYTTCYNRPAFGIASSRPLPISNKQT
jgi:transposase